MRGKFLTKIYYLLISLFIPIALLSPLQQVNASHCPELRIVFARGSGGERWQDQNYLTFKATIESKLSTTNLNYEFIDLDYPAVSIGLDKLSTTIGALFGSGDAYEFGESIDTGVQNLQNLINSSGCPNTKYVLGGYSQGAMVISKALQYFKSERIIYAATFGDPKIYLPEGRGFFPSACRGENLSDYRMYVPDCHAFKGLLGAYQPYEPDSLIGKVGTWCNNRDIFCSSKHYNLGDIADHISYIKDGLYEDASRVIFDKITKTFNITNHFTSPHDTVFLIDSTSSMGYLIDKYKEEALRLATKTVESGGRIALYDYRDLRDPYEPVQHCNFEDCTLTKFQQELDLIETAGGGDVPESLFSASYHAMQALNWQQGSTKSIVVLTDADFISPDFDGTTMDDVIELSKRIDPVNFYIITTPEYASTYYYFTSATDGKVVTDLGELDLLTDYIMERYDSLPRVEENSAPTELPEIEITSASQINEKSTSVTIQFNNSGKSAIISLNDQILGLTVDTEITINDLDFSKQNTITLTPLNSNMRGNPVIINPVPISYGETNAQINRTQPYNYEEAAIQIPKAPNTGKV